MNRSERFVAVKPSDINPGNQIYYDGVVRSVIGVAYGQKWPKRRLYELLLEDGNQLQLRPKTRVWMRIA